MLGHLKGSHAELREDAKPERLGAVFPGEQGNQRMLRGSGVKRAPSSGPGYNTHSHTLRCLEGEGGYEQVLKEKESILEKGHHFAPIEIYCSNVKML